MTKTPLTAEEFAALTAWEKGYVVYMCGAREDQPNVPESYEPAPEDALEYARGQQQAVIAVMDAEE